MTLKQNDQIDIIGLNYKDNKKNAVIFLQDLGNPYEKIFIDLDGTQAIEWGAYGVPESFLIYNNKIIKKYIGPLNEDLISEIEYLIK
jgi:cytochrome c biogenesis protein CcmG/thiol:disulfide interchange protein DsbE